MEVRFLPNEVEFWLNVRETPPRTDGLHVSTVVLAMLQAVSKHFRMNYGKGDMPDRNPVYEMGYAWEDALSSALSKRQKFGPHQTLLPSQELAVDEIYGTPDRILFDHDENRFVIDELKCTWMSCRDVETDPQQIVDETKFQYWLMQKKTYAAMLHRAYAFSPKTHTLLKLNGGRDDLKMLIAPAQTPIVVVRALFVNGSYRGDRAKPIAWEFRYTAAELDAYWEAVLRFKRDMEAVGKQAEGVTE